MMRTLRYALPLLMCPVALADAPVASYIFPAGGRRGTAVEFKVGGLFLHKTCDFAMEGPGIKAPGKLIKTDTVWFEGSVLPLPESQRAEDYPKDSKGKLEIAADAPLGIRKWRVSTSQGAAAAMMFVVGDLPEIVEQETAGEPKPVTVSLPVTVNGRIFPREDVDSWSCVLKAGQTLTAAVDADRIGSSLDARLEVIDPQGRRIAEGDDSRGSDPTVRFTAPADGEYQVRIFDVRFDGGQAFVYRLTLTAGPYVDRVFPLGGRRGTKTKFEVAGSGLGAGSFEIDLPKDGATHLHQLAIGADRTNPFELALDDQPEFVHAGDDKPMAFTVPAILNGRIAKPGATDAWALTLKKGESVDLALDAGRLGSRLDPVLSVLDGAGKPAGNADAPGSGADRTLTFKAPVDGTYTVQVRDRFRSRGGVDFAYRLSVRTGEGPSIRLRPALELVNLSRGGEAKLKMAVERAGGVVEPIALSFEGLPAGVTVEPKTVNAKAAQVELKFKSAADAKIASLDVRVIGTATVAGKPIVGSSEPVRVSVALSAPYVITADYDMKWAARGGMTRHKFRITRNGFVGPLEVSLADRQARHLQGVTGGTIIVPPEADEFLYAVYLPPWMETGRTSRTVVMAVGLIKDEEGREHEVSFSSVKQNEQIVAVVGPGRLGIEADRTSVRGLANSSAELTVRVRRDRTLAGPVTLTLIAPPDMTAVRAETVTIPADSSEGKIVLRFADKVPAAWPMPLLVRATLMDKTDPVIAEFKVDVEGE